MLRTAQDSAAGKMFYCYRDNNLYESKLLTEAAGLTGVKYPVVSAVGAGGKTTTLRRLADEYVQSGIPVIVTTTTHMAAGDKPWFLTEPSVEKIEDMLERYGQVWAGLPSSSGKIKSLPAEMMKEIWNMALPILIEADGSRQLPLKIPADHEPVILPETTHVLSVYGLDSIGQKLSEVCFRPERAAVFLKKNISDRVTAEDIALLAASYRGGRKGCPDSAVYTVVLNKADDEMLVKEAVGICRTLSDTGIQRIIISGC